MKKKSKIRVSLLMALVFLALFMVPFPRPCLAAAQVYVAGTPDAWPFEFYDKGQKEYRGILPDMLREAASRAGVTLEYIQPSPRDERLALAANIQVDAVTTAGLSREDWEEAGLTAGPALLAGDDQEEPWIYLAYTKSMDEENKEKLQAALEEFDKEEIGRLYLVYAKEADAARRSPFAGALHWWLVFALLVLALLLGMPLFYWKKKKQAERLAYRDRITGRNNFDWWTKACSRTVVEGNRSHYCILYLYTGVDTINHIYGYEEAHEALRMIADACSSMVEPWEGMARIHEFCFVFYVQYGNVEKLKERIRSILGRIEEAFNNKRYFLDLHVGIYRLGNADRDPEKNVQYARVAAEYASVHEADYAVYDEFLEKETISGYAMEHEAIHGLLHREFLMYIQPIVHPATGKICGGEALVRWQNPNRGLLKPDAFLDVMKKKNLTGRMNMEIFTQGCRFLQEQKGKGRRLKLVFNFTVDNVREEKFPGQIHKIVKSCQVDPDQVVIQLNQLVEMSRSEQFMDSIKKLRGFGFDVFLSGLELDNVFFRYLECRVNGVKLRPELIHRSDVPEGRKVLETVTNLCRELKLAILCVGVEKETEAEYVHRLGCEMASGYYYYYPVSQEVFQELLEN